MVDVDISIIFAGLSIAASIVYYTSILQNANKTQKMQLETRQAQLFMEVFREYRGLEFRRQRLQVLGQKWTNFDDWWEKYGGLNNPEEWANWQSVAAYFSGVGVLVKRGLVDI